MGRYGVAGLFPGSQQDLPFLLYAQSVPRPAWSGTRDVHRESLDQVYEFLITARADIQDGDGVGTIVNTFDARGGVAACEATVCVDDGPPGAGERLSFFDTES
jgi:hypothetical protein